MKCTNHPPSGLWRPSALKYLYYGENIVESKLPDLLTSALSKVAIMTSHSLATETPLVRDIEELLGPTRHAITIQSIKEDNSITELEEAFKRVCDEPQIDTIISVGGMSSIDAAKWMSMKVQERRQNVSSMELSASCLNHICVPTTLAAAECTAFATYTDVAGQKQIIQRDLSVGPTAILYDPRFASYTPLDVWLSTGIRALDHAIELMCHPSAVEVPCKEMCLSSAAALYQYLPKARWSHKGDGTCDTETTIRLFLAAFGSLQFMGGNTTGLLGLSHKLGHALSTTCGIPYGETSCLTLGPVVKLKARSSPENAEQIARLLPFVTDEGPIWEKSDVGNEIRIDKALIVADTILELVERLGLKKPLAKYGVDKEQIEVIVDTTLDNHDATINGDTHKNGATPEVDQEDREDVKRLVEGLFDWNDMNSYDSIHAENLLVNNGSK